MRSLKSTQATLVARSHENTTMHMYIYNVIISSTIIIMIINSSSSSSTSMVSVLSLVSNYYEYC